jgi:hypothetical protein
LSSSRSGVKREIAIVTKSRKPRLEVAGSVDRTVGVAVSIRGQSRRVARSRDLLLAAKAVAWRAGSSHSIVVHSRFARALLLSPQPPGDDCKAADEDCTADTTDYTADDSLGLW